MVSIIVPVYNEEAGLKAFISYLQKHTFGKRAELIFIDGGSTDKTVEICKEFGIKIYTSPIKGRASQMNYGAEKAPVIYYTFYMQIHCLRKTLSRIF